MSTNSTYTREGGKNTLLLSRYFFRRRRGSDGYCYYGSLVETRGQRERVRDVTETEAGVIVCVLKNEDEIRSNPLCTLLLKTPTYPPAADGQKVAALLSDRRRRFGGDIGGRRSSSSSPTFPLRLQRVQPPLRSHHSFRHKWQGGEDPDSGHRWLGVVPTHLLRRLLLRRCWGSLCLKCSLVE